MDLGDLAELIVSEIGLNRVPKDKLDQYGFKQGQRMMIRTFYPFAVGYKEAQEGYKFEVMAYIPFRKVSIDGG